MGLLLKKQRDGKRLRSCWYGSYTENNGTRRVINLNVEWRGTPPPSLKVSDLGDTAFEKSRGRAQDALDRYVDESRRKGRADNLTERLIQSKTGKSIEYVSIEELPQKWRNVGRNSKPTDDYLAGCDATFRRFIKFMKRNNPAAKYLYEIT